MRTQIRIRWFVRDATEIAYEMPKNDFIIINLFARSLGRSLAIKWICHIKFATQIIVNFRTQIQMCDRANAFGRKRNLASTQSRNKYVECSVAAVVALIIIVCDCPCRRVSHSKLLEPLYYPIKHWSFCACECSLLAVVYENQYQMDDDDNNNNT